MIPIWILRIKWRIRILCWRINSVVPWTQYFQIFNSFYNFGLHKVLYLVLVYIFLVTSFPGYQLSSSPVFLVTSFPGYQFSWLPIFLVTSFLNIRFEFSYAGNLEVWKSKLKSINSINGLRPFFKHFNSLDFEKLRYVTNLLKTHHFSSTIKPIWKKKFTAESFRLYSRVLSSFKKNLF